MLLGASSAVDKRSCHRATNPSLPAPTNPPTSTGLQGHTEIIWAIEVHGDRVYTASADKTVRVWDLNTRRCVQVRVGGRVALNWLSRREPRCTQLCTGSLQAGWGARCSKEVAVWQSLLCP